MFGTFDNIFYFPVLLILKNSIKIKKSKLIYIIKNFELIIIL